MRKGLLTKAELDALMGLFDGDDAIPETVADAVKGGGRTDVSALKAQLESDACRWTGMLETLTGTSAQVKLRTIVRVSGTAVESSEAAFRCAESPERYLIIPEALVNLINEKSLGSLEEFPAMSHRLTRIDRALFESTGAAFAGDRALAVVEALPENSSWLEARFAVEIIPLLRTTLRLMIDEKSL